jgi:hypothetical protein
MSRLDAAEEYRRRAEHCVKLARALARAEDKLILLEMAQAWLRLAEQATKNRATDLVYETPRGRRRPSAPSPPQAE